MTAIRGYVRLGGLPDNPRTDPQDRAWFGPHDRLFVEEESEPVEFASGPEYGKFSFGPFVCPHLSLPSKSSPCIPVFGIHIRDGCRALNLTMAAGPTLSVEH